MSPFANRPYWKINGRSSPKARLAFAICSGSVLLPTARRAGSPAGSFTKIRNVRIEMTISTRTE
jgi:hypothetical protein